MGLLTGPQARPARANGKRAAGPGRTSQGQAAEGGRMPDPGHPTQRHEVPLSGRPWAAPTARKEHAM